MQQMSFLRCSARSVRVGICFIFRGIRQEQHRCNGMRVLRRVHLRAAMDSLRERWVAVFRCPHTPEAREQLQSRTGEQFMANQ